MERIRGTRPIEDEANYFALMILMPTQLLRNELKKPIDLCGNDLVKTLAKKFDVPENAVVQRLAILKIEEAKTVNK